MNLRSVTLPQAIVLCACLAAVILAYKFVSPEAAGITTFVGMIVNLLLGRTPPQDPPSTGDGPNLKVIAGGAATLLALGMAGASLTHCGALNAADDPGLQTFGGDLAQCRAQGRAVAADAGEDAGLATYDACKKDGGLE